uniref:Transmembrane ascorbate-dependent reductase CYB561 n=1 Tax=Cyprinus carpio TaxID=7962 RepID=A0A8C1WKS7_CYPCA
MYIHAASSLLRTLPWYVAGSQVLGVACVVITGVWMGHYRGGYAWDGSAQFNVHPLCMVLGLVFLYGDAQQLNTQLRNSLQNIYIFFIQSIFNTLKLRPAEFITSGLLWTDCFSSHFLQWLLGLGFFLFPWASAQLRSWYLPLHVFFGLLLLAMSVGSCLLGITEKLESYIMFTGEGVLANTLGLLLVCFGVVVGYVVTREDFRRPPNPEEEALSVHFKTLSEGEIPSSP